MKYIIILFLIFISNHIYSQTISGIFRGDRVKNFKLSEKYISIDGFGSTKTTSIEYIDGRKDLYHIKFKSNRYIVSFEKLESINLMVIETPCKKYKLSIKKFKKLQLK